MSSACPKAAVPEHTSIPTATHPASAPSAPLRFIPTSSFMRSSSQESVIPLELAGLQLTSGAQGPHRSGLQLPLRLPYPTPRNRRQFNLRRLERCRLLYTEIPDRFNPH